MLEFSIILFIFVIRCVKFNQQKENYDITNRIL